MTMNEEKTKKLVRLTAGGTSAMVASKNQIIPFAMKTSTDQDLHTERGPVPHLFPKEASQMERTASVNAQAEQANKHDEK
jgi:hypothetical protein